jgi:hypothetical protein
MILSRKSAPEGIEVVYWIEEEAEIRLYVTRKIIE